MQVELQTFVFANSSIQLYVPTSDEVKQWYHQQNNNNPATPFPYWAKVWPSAIALCTFLADHPQYIQNKNLLEVAAGLGLPSLFAAQYAENICCTDYLQQPLTIVQQSIKYNHLQNIFCEVYNWNDAPKNCNADVVLLSDINYEPSAFANLYKMIQHFLAQNATIIIATPQRLMGKVFVDQLLPFSKQQETIEIEKTLITILVLQQHSFNTFTTL